MENVTQLLQRLRGADGDAAAVRERLYDLVYPALRGAAERQLKRERPDPLLQPTAVVHEAFLKLIQAEQIDWRSRAHFLAVATRAMRQVLVDHARAAKSEKRGGGAARLTLDDAVVSAPDAAIEILELDRALARLSGVSERMSKVVEFRVIAGMTHDEIAQCLEISTRTAAEDWAVGRRYLARELLGEAS